MKSLSIIPNLLILDEPTAFLDLPRRVEIVRLLRWLAHNPDIGQAVLLSTHDLDLALRSADRVWLMSSSSELQVGAPEDLVLSGVFEATFQSEGVEFDRMTGSFNVATQPGGTIRLIGTGIPAFWTGRALGRIGFKVSHSDEPVGHSSLEVEIINQHDSVQWLLKSAGETKRYTSLYGLVSFLRGKV